MFKKTNNNTERVKVFIFSYIKYEMQSIRSLNATK